MPRTSDSCGWNSLLKQSGGPQICCSSCDWSKQAFFGWPLLVWCLQYKLNGRDFPSASRRFASSDSYHNDNWMNRTANSCLTDITVILTNVWGSSCDYCLLQWTWKTTSSIDNLTELGNHKDHNSGSDLAPSPPTWVSCQVLFPGSWSEGESLGKSLAVGSLEAWSSAVVDYFSHPKV